MFWQIMKGLVDPVGKIGELLAEAYVKKQDAQTEQEKINAQVEIEQLQLRQAILIEEQQFWLTKWIRPAFAYPLAFYYAKLWVWDKALGWGSSADLTEKQFYISITIIGFYFLARPAEKWLVSKGLVGR